MTTKISKKQFIITLGLVTIILAVMGWLLFDSTMIRKEPTQKVSYTPPPIPPARAIKTAEEPLMHPTKPTIQLFTEVKSKRAVVYINDNTINHGPAIITGPLIDSAILRRHDVQIVPANDDLYKRNVIIIPMDYSIDWRKKAQLICSNGNIKDIYPIESINNLNDEERMASASKDSDADGRHEYYFNGFAMGWVFKKPASQEDCPAKFIVFTPKNDDAGVRITYKKSTKTISPSYPSQPIKDIRNAIESSVSFFEIDSNPNIYWQANWLLDIQKESYDNIIKTYAREIGLIQDKKVVSLFSSYVREDMDGERGMDLGGHMGELRIEDDTASESWHLFSFSLYEVFGYFRFLLTPDLKATHFGYVELGGS